MIEFRGVYKAYDNGTKALKDVNLKINKGEFVFIVGASGAGKSTFIKLIMHEEKPNAGEVVVGKYKMSKLKRRDIPKLRRMMGIVFQDFRLIKEMTVFDNVAFAMHVVGASKKEIRKTVARTLNIVGLADKARCYPDELSGGEQQRIALARALVNQPDMILADEPTGNVDPNMSYEIVELLTEINARGTTVIMVTHEHQLVRDFGHRVVMIENGAVVADNELTPTATPMSTSGSLMPEMGTEEQRTRKIKHYDPSLDKPVQTIGLEVIEAMESDGDLTSVDDYKPIEEKNIEIVESEEQKSSENESDDLIDLEIGNIDDIISQIESTPFKLDEDNKGDEK